MRVLFITSFLPKYNASQAGVNFSYNIIKILNKNLNCTVDLLCTLNEEEKENSEDDIREITENRIYHYLNKKQKIKNVLKSIFKPIIVSVRYDSRVIKELKKLKKTNENYDYIILDYTQNINYINYIKKEFPSSKTILLEQDVSFLGFKRKYENSKGILKLLYKIEYLRLKKYELDKINLFDKVYTVNEKDEKLLHGNKNVEVLHPFINQWDVSYKEHSTFNIMFWGAMNRAENEDAVLNFIHNIWTKIDRDNVRFYILGAKPSEKIKALASNNIIVSGFIDDPGEYFSIMDISVVPLRLGAGIKIKVLESMSSGIPTITTSVGAEGIEIENGEEAFITDDYNEFSSYINLLKNNSTFRKEMSIKSKKKISEKYSFSYNEKILKKFIDNKR